MEKAELEAQGGVGVGTEEGMGEQLHKIATRTLTRLPTVPRCGDVT